MKKHILLIVTILFSTIMCKADYNFKAYVYPVPFHSYYSPDSSGKNPISVTLYSFESYSFDKYIIEEIYAGGRTMVGKNIYRYRIVNNTVVSDVQLCQNAISGTTKHQDDITLFAFPIDGNPYKWTEIDRGDKIQCTSEYVYIMVSGKCMKSIKITKDNKFTVGKEKHRSVEKSYWVQGYGRIFTFSDLDGTERMSSKLNAKEFDDVTEISEVSEEQYISYKERIKMEKEMKAFKEAIKPQSFQQKYPEYYKDILNVIGELVNNIGPVELGLHKFAVTIASGDDISIKDEVFYSQIDMPVKEYIAKLLEENKVKLETIINPETRQIVEIPLIFETYVSANMVYRTYSLDYIKNKWKVYEQTPFEEDLINAAEKYRLENKRAKKIKMDALILNCMNKQILRDLQDIRIRKD